MARMASARTMPKAVAQLVIAADVGTLDLVSTLMPAATAASRALLICAAVRACGVWISQPDVIARRPSRRTACSVITVLGAEVPGGRPLTSWILGPARQSLLGQGKVSWPLWVRGPVPLV